MMLVVVLLQLVDMVFSLVVCMVLWLVLGECSSLLYLVVDMEVLLSLEVRKFQAHLEEGKKEF